MMRITHLLALLGHIPLFGWHMLCAIPAAGWRSVPRRILLFVPLIVLFALLNLQHCIGFVLDELLFRGYRRIRVHAPVFILGIPRSGTTHLQRVLAHDPRFTTLRTWEALLAPSVTERYVYLAVGRALTWLQRPARHLRQRWMGRMDTIHVLGLNEPEEDFLLWLPLQACLLLAFAHPHLQRYRDLGAFHQRLPASHRAFLLGYYRACLQKHLYFHGQHLRILSKNPSFTSLLPDLAECFPDAAFVLCVRPPPEVIASQLSALRPAFALLEGGDVPPRIVSTMLDILQHYYALAGAWQNRALVVEMRSLNRDLCSVLTCLYHHVSLDLPPELEAEYRKQAQASATYQSRHRYRSDEFSLSPEQVAAFASSWPLPAASNQPSP